MTERRQIKPNGSGGEATADSPMPVKLEGEIEHQCVGDS
jgi:hypothetical protein